LACLMMLPAQLAPATLALAMLAQAACAQNGLKSWDDRAKRD
jgi:hypothetical protein